MKPSEIRGKKEKKQLQALLEEKREALFGLRLQRATRQLAKTASFKGTKRDIGRILTIMKEFKEKE